MNPSLSSISSAQRRRAIYHLAKADFLERIRRVGFLVTLAATSYFGYLAWVGRIHLSSHNFTGVSNSAWTGTLMSIVASTFLSLIGFYIVRQTVERDRMTRVGPILATTPASGFEYLLGKFLSNLAVLCAMLSVLAVAAVVLQFLRHQGGSFNLVALVSPFLLIALPAMALVAAIAVLFDVTPGLSGGLGNIIYFFVWTFGLAASIQLWRKLGALVFTDPLALGMTESQLGRAALAAGADPKASDFALNIGGPGGASLTQFLWPGIQWSAALIFGRLFWIFVAVAIVALASLWFHRFDPAYESLRRWKPARTQEPEELQSAPTPSPAPQIAWRNLTAVTRGTSFLPLVVSELRLALRGRQWWWKVGVAGIIIAGLASPKPSVPLIFAAIWPMLVLAQLGCREAKFDTATLIYNSPISGIAHVFAAWIAGALVALLLFSGALLRMLVTRDPHFVPVIIGACFISALAVCFGTLSGGTKLFEAVYICLWYVGPANAAPDMDFVGTTPGAAPSHFALYAAALLITAFAARSVRQRAAV
jgi:hypothetical protein